MLDPIIASLSFKNLAEPMVEILKDGTALLALAAILEAAGVTDFIPDELKQEIVDGVYDSVPVVEKALTNAWNIGATVTPVGRTGRKLASVWAWLVVQGNSNGEMNNPTSLYTQTQP
jgi:hypothetical protein